MLRRALRRTLGLAALAGLACAKDTRTVITVYTTHGTELMTDVKSRFERTYPTIEVQWVSLESRELLERVRAEKASPKADVWFGAPSELFDRAASEGLLATYASSWSSAISADAKDTAGFWYGTYLTPEVIGYNSEAVKPGEAPRDWNDLADAKWKGKLVMRDPIASAAMRAIFGAMLQRSIAQTGSTEQGWRWLERIDANTREYTASSTDLYQKLGRKNGVVTMYNMPDLATLQARTKIPVKVVMPASATPLLVDGIAIVQGSAHDAAARTFLDFVVSKPVMLITARDHLRIPARNDLSADSLPVWIRDAQKQMLPMAMDRRLMSDSLNSWMTAWDMRVRGRFRSK